MTLDEPLRKFLDDLAARTPTPGGGSASALIGALGAALGSMGAVFTAGEKFKNVEARTQDILHRCEALRGRLAGLIDADIAAYQAYAAARKLPKGTDAEQAARKAAIAKAREEATRVPEAIVAAAHEGLEWAAQLAPICNPNLVSDAAVAAYALEAAARGAGLQVLCNLAPDPATAERRKRVREKLAACQRLCEQVETETLKTLKLTDDTP